MASVGSRFHASIVALDQEGFVIPGRAVYLPARDFDREESEIRKDIEANERLSNALWRMLPAFVTESAVQRMGIEAIANVLEEFRRAFRDWMCGGEEYQLEQLRKERAEPQPNWKPPKPTIEQLMAARMSVQRMEEAVEAMDNLGEKDDHIYAGPLAFMRPIVEMQLDQARDYLSRIQAAMEESDEAAEPAMSNGKEPGEDVPDEAKP